jgi:Holliday junction resolvasome RuvABC endonuclease subunit
VIVMGFDPGPTWTGWATIEISGNLLPQFIDGGKVKSLPDSFDELIHERGRIDLIAIERCGMAFRAAAANALIRTSEIAGLLHGLALWSSVTGVVLQTSFEVRKALIGKRNASDAEVKMALQNTVLGLPKTNAHVRDAIAVAVVAWRAWR